MVTQFGETAIDSKNFKKFLVTKKGKYILARKYQKLFHGATLC